MKANELRIGNWAYDPYEKMYFKVSPPDIDFLDEGGDSESILPVPLTAEILLKIGFLHCNSVETKGGDIFYDYDLMELGICGADACGPSQIYYANCKYVHQLQNLYFALTGEELEIKL